MFHVIKRVTLSCQTCASPATRYSPPRHRLTSFLLLGLLIGPFSSTLAQLSQSDPNWVTTWSTSPSTLPPQAPATDSLDNQTLRLITHSSIGGDALRIRLSNAHGDRPVHIAAITVAMHRGDSEIISESNKSILFAGQREITIPRGATVISDPIAFELPQSGNLALSLYVPGESGFITSHALANQASYISTAGNFTDSTILTDAAESTGWPFLTAIDVLPSQPTTAIVTLGDSITDGWGSTAGANQRWPNHFAHRLYADDSINDYAVINAGISGNRVTTEESPLFGQNLLARFERDVLAMSNVSHVILMEGINDIGMSARTENLINAQQIIAVYRQVIARAHARGIKVFGAVLLPYEGAAYYTEEGNQVRNQVNTFIRDSGEFDGFIEFDKAVQDPANPNRIRADFTADNLHPNDAGYAAMAQAIDLELFR